MTQLAPDDLEGPLCNTDSNVAAALRDSAAVKRDETAKVTVLYAFGSNGSHQLGVGHEEDISRPQRCYFATSSDSESRNCVQVIDSIPLEQGEEIIRLIGGGNHTLLLTGHGIVWATGSDENGRCGFGGRSEPVEEDSDIASARRPLDGVWRCLSWTRGAKQGSYRAIGKPIETGIDTGLFVTDIAATFTASYFVVDACKIYSCGAGAKGELGLGHNVVESQVVQKCFEIGDHEEGESIVGISACMSHVVTWSTSGKLYGWGSCRKGQLGEFLRSEMQGAIWSPCEIDIGDLFAEQVVTGKDFTFVLGRTVSEQLFLGDCKKVGVENHRLNLDVEAGSRSRAGKTLKIYAGWTHLTAHLLDASILGFGRNYRGQLLENPPMEKIARFAMGSEHSLAALQDDRVIAWGWGEHGNCGPDVDDRGNVKSRYNVVFGTSATQKVLGIAAGCATSFIWIQDTR